MKVPTNLIGALAAACLVGASVAYWLGYQSGAAAGLGTALLIVFLRRDHRGQ